MAVYIVFIRCICVDGSLSSDSFHMLSISSRLPVQPSQAGQEGGTNKYFKRIQEIKVHQRETKQTLSMVVHTVLLERRRRLKK